jgi:hypothetical protein
MCRVSARRLSIYNFVWGLVKATKKVYLIPQKLKKRYIWDLSDKICNLNKKKVIEIPNQPIETKKNSNKSMFSISKMKRRQNSYRGYLKKLSEHQIYQSGRIFFQQSMLSTLKMKRSQKFVWELPDGICKLNPKC